MNSIVPRKLVTGCSFCMYASDIGVSDQRLWLPAEATHGFCSTCEESCNSFMDSFDEIVERLPLRRPADLSSHRLSQLMKMPFHSPLSTKENGLNTRPRYVNWLLSKLAMGLKSVRFGTESKIDGRDVTRFQGIHFCQGCAWPQLDVKKISICNACRKEKYSIMKHRHGMLHVKTLSKSANLPPKLFFMLTESLL